MYGQVVKDKIEEQVQAVMGVYAAFGLPISPLLMEKTTLFLYHTGDNVQHKLTATIIANEIK